MLHQYREISLEEKKKWYAEVKNITRETVFTADSITGELVPYTEEEFDDWIMHQNHPDFDVRWNQHIGQRENCYPNKADQLDVIWKTFGYLSDNGIDIGPLGKEMLDQIRDIKEKYPKWTGVEE